MLHCNAERCGHASYCAPLSCCCSHSTYACLQARSLLTAHEGFTSLLFTATAPILRPGFIFATLKQQGIPEDTVEQAKRMSLTADNHSAIFDVPSDCVEVDLASSLML